MAFAEFCMLFLACAILALVRVLASILQEHRLESVTEAISRPPGRNAPPRHPVPDGRHQPGVSHIASAVSEVAPRSAGLRVRIRSPPLLSAHSMANASLSGPSTSAAGPSTSRTSHSTPAAGPSTSRTSHSTPAAGSSTSRTSLSASIGASVPWSPKKGWTSTCRVNGVTYHRTEKKMRPRKSFKAGSEEPELVITPYWEPESVAARLIDYPPDLSSDPNLAVGDVFIFHTAMHYRLWIYRPGGVWEQVEVSFQREDGRFLIVTPVKKEPSWVSRDYFERQTKQAESDSD